MTVMVVPDRSRGHNLQNACACYNEHLQNCVLLLKKLRKSASAILARHHHLFLNCEGRWGTTDDFTTSFLHFSLFSTALWDLANCRPVHSLMFIPTSSSVCLVFFPLSLCLPCKMVLARPDERETWPYHCSLHLFTMSSGFLCGSWHGLPRW